MSVNNQTRYRSIVSGLFLVLLFLVVSLPTGSIWGLNVKVIAMGLFLAVFALYLSSGSHMLSRGDVVFLALVGGSLCFWSLVGILRGHAESSQTISQSREAASAIFIGWLGISLVRKGVVRPERLISVVIYALVAMGCLKLAVIAGMVVNGTDPIQSIESVFGEGSLVGGAYALGLVRLEFASDILAPFGLFALLAPSVSGVRFGRISTLVMSALLITSGLMAYSRYKWFAFVCAALAAGVIQRSWKVLVTTILCVLLLGVWFGDVFSSVFEDRFRSVAADISDEGRAHQSKALLEEIKERPILGKGVGTHAVGHISRPTAPYSYELQWLAFMMQFGIVGSFGIFLLVAASVRDLLLAKHPAKLYVGLLFLIWLSAAWANPAMTSSFAGAAFAMFMAMFYRMRSVAPVRGITVGRLVEA